MDRVRRVYQTASQNVSGMLSKSYADPLVKLSGLTAINDREAHLEKILEDCAKNRNANPKDQDKINTAMVKLFHKMTASQDPNTGAQDLYYKYVNDSVIQNTDVNVERIFDSLLGSSGLRNRSQGISSLAFAFATILALSLHREDTSQSSLSNNKTSPYFDLSPLYGANDTERSSMRRKDGRGMLWPDTFTEKRLDMLPDSVPALLVLWNRYHNYVAKQLLSYNEDDKWNDPDPKLSSDQYLAQDEEIFDLARSITCIHFMNVVKEDFLKGLIGTHMVGPNAQFDILYDIKGMKNGNAGYFSSVESYLLYSFSSFTPPSFSSKAHELVKQGKGPSVVDVRRRTVGNLQRNIEDRFEDNDLANLLFDAVEAYAASPGGKAIPDWEREREILKLRQARQANVCTLNKFRQYLGLKPLESFEEWNPDLANAAENLYESDINKLELYPGLLCERSNGRGFGFGYTMTWGLIADIVTRIRCDPIFQSKFNEHILTKWGYKDCMSSIDYPKLNGSSLYNTAGSFGGMLPKLFQRTLPHNCPYDNIYCLFPLLVPGESKAWIEKLPPADRKKYSTDRPKRAKIKVLKTLKAISEVLNDPQTFPSPYKQNLIELTGGYGHVLGFDDLTLHDRDLMMTLFSLMPDKGAVRRIGASFARKAQENLKRRSRYVDAEQKIASIDVVQDVIDATCIRWVCETIYNLRFKDDIIWGMSKERTDKVREESREEEKKERENFASHYAYVFRNAEPEFGWNVREMALTASEHLRQHLKQQIPRDKDRPSDARYAFYTQRVLAALWRFILRLREEYTTGKMLPQHSALTFLDRMVKKGHIKPLGELTYEIDHLAEIKERHRQEARPEIEAKVSRGLIEHIRKEGLLKSLFLDEPQVPEHEVEDIANRKLEEQRVIANVMGLAVVICVHFSKACAQAIDFYLDDKYSTERDALVALCRDPSSSNERIMGYIREAQRIGQRFGVWRNVALPSDSNRIIEQGRGYPDVIIEPGDRVFADFTFAHNDPNQVPEPQMVKTDRKMKSLLGLGVHKCPAGSFIDQTMPQIFRVIFKQQNLKRASGRKGQLKATTLHPDTAVSDSEVYLNDDSSFAYYPKHMEVEFDASGLKKEDWEIKKDTAFEKYRLMVDRGISITTIISVFIAIIYFYTSSQSTSTSSSGPTLLSAHCAEPLKTIEDWHIKTFRPQYGLLGGEPAPIIYRTPWRLWGRKSHQISIVDIDKRDIDLRVWVDNEDWIPDDVDLDPTVDCGDDIQKCLELNFASALVVIPPGRHTVKAEIRKRNASVPFDWGKERQRRVMWTVQQCA